MSYRNIELSDPAYECDHLRFLTFKSPALKGRGDVSLFVPPDLQGTRDLPLVVLLHGVYGSHWAWALKGGAHRTAWRLIEDGQIGPMVLAMPSDGLRGDGTGYVAHTVADYERWIMEDVIGCVTEVVPCLSPASPLFLTGLSMGGYGALRLGAKYARRVRGISAHSSATRLDTLAPYFAEPVVTGGNDGDADLLYWMQKHQESLPALRFDCGRSDPLIEDNRRLHKALSALGITHHYDEFEGEHNWAYWQAHIGDTLLFFNEL
jgi:enterochelin esterase-like enzyme